MAISLSVTRADLLVLMQGQSSADLLPDSGDQSPTNASLIFSIAGKMIPERSVFAGCSHHKEDRAKDHRHESPDRAQCERKGKVGKERACVTGMPYQSVGT